MGTNIVCITVLAATALPAPTLSKIVVDEWRYHRADQRHQSHQTSDPSQITSTFRSGLSPYQHVPLAKRGPNTKPPYVPSASTPQCIEVIQSERSMSARNQEEICHDWAIGKYWLTEDRDNGRAVWRMPKHTHAIRYQGDSFGWWIHRDRDRHGYPCMGEARTDQQDPLGCDGFGHQHWAACAVRRCEVHGNGLEQKLRSLTTKRLRAWAGKLGLNVESHERRDIIVQRLREALYLNDGHADLSKYEEFMETAIEWGNARYAETLAEMSEGD